MPRTRSSRSDSSSRKTRNFAAIALAAFSALGFVCRPAHAQTETVLYSFKGPTADGGDPAAGVTLDAAGNIYGTTWKGGAINSGTVFELSKHGEALMHSFRGPDGEKPLAGLIRDAAGNLYGTTTVGGGLSCFGAVFKVSPTGKETVLHCFAGQPTDGAFPLAGLLRDQKGNLYGTTYLGGTKNVGIVFMLDPAGNETVLHSFTGGSIGEPDGATPNGGLVPDPAGNLYGATIFGGLPNAGIVYKIDASGNETVIYSFAGTPDGQYPMGNLARDSAGNLYGVTNVGGSNNLGSLFKIDATGKETLLHSFGLAGDCEAPQAGVIRDAQGNLLGTANGGRPDYGAVFKFETNTGKETIVHFFKGGRDDGEYPVGALAIDSQGYIYGATQEGGANNWGTVFKIGP